MGAPLHNRNHATTGTWSDGNGYVQVSVRGKQMREHIYIAMLALGRELLPTELVHHIDGDRSNNDPANLEIVSAREHRGERHRKTRKSCDVCFRTHRRCVHV